MRRSLLEKARESDDIERGLDSKENAFEDENSGLSFEWKEEGHQPAISVTIDVYKKPMHQVSIAALR